MISLTLEDELEILLSKAYTAAFGKEPSADWVSAMSMRAGALGSVATLDQAGEVAGVTRERVRQVMARVTPYARRATLNNVKEVATCLAEHSPVLEPIGRRLARSGLSRQTLTGNGFLNILKLIGTSPKELIGTNLVVADGWLVEESDVPVMKSIAVAKRHTSAFGMTTVEEIRQALASPSNPLNSNDIRRILKSESTVRWAGEWLWVEREVDGLHSNRLVNTARTVLSVNSPQTVTSIHEGARRLWKFRKLDILPPTTAMHAFFDASPFFEVEGDLVRPVEPLDYHDVVGDVTATMIDVLKASHYEVMDRQSLTEACADAGIASGTYGIWTTYAEWMERFAPNVWGLRGSNPNPAAVEVIRSAALSRTKAEPRRKSWKWAADGSAVQTMDLTTSILSSGVLSFDQGVHDLLAGEAIAITVSSEPVTTVKVGANHIFSWGWHPVFSKLSAKQGDVIQIRVNVATRSASVQTGSEELWA